MIIDVRRACTGNIDEFEIYIDKKITYFANIGKKIRLFDKNGDILIKKLKKGFLGKALVRDENKKKAFTVLKRKDRSKKVYFGIRPENESRVYRVQTFFRDNSEYLMFTEDKMILAAAKSVDERTVYRLYVRDQNAELHKTFLIFLLYYCL